MSRDDEMSLPGTLVEPDGTRRPVTDDDGDCFKRACQVARELPGSLICHGQPLSTNPRHFGERFWHAWVEYRNPAGGGWVVIDRSNRNNVQMRRANWYRAGNIEPDKVERFTMAQALDMMRERGHWGPWADAWSPGDGSL